jgi:hypothetical protein
MPQFNLDHTRSTAIATLDGKWQQALQLHEAEQRELYTDDGLEKPENPC